MVFLPSLLCFLTLSQALKILRISLGTPLSMEQSTTSTSPLWSLSQSFSLSFLSLLPPFPSQPRLRDKVEQFAVFQIKNVSVGVFGVARSNFATTTNLGPNITVYSLTMSDSHQTLSPLLSPLSLSLWVCFHFNCSHPPQVSNATIAYYSAIERLNDENVKVIILFLSEVRTIADIQVDISFPFLPSSHCMMFSDVLSPQDLLLVLPNIDVVIVRDMPSIVYPYLLLSTSNWYAVFTKEISPLSLLTLLPTGRFLSSALTLLAFPSVMPNWISMRTVDWMHLMGLEWSWPLTFQWTRQCKPGKGMRSLVCFREDERFGWLRYIYT